MMRYMVTTVDVNGKTHWSAYGRVDVAESAAQSEERWLNPTLAGQWNVPALASVTRSWEPR